MKLTTEHIKKFHKDASSSRTEIEDEIEEIFLLMTPEKSFREMSQVMDRSRIYDTTALRSNGVLTTTVLANYIPVGREWMKMTQTKKNIKDRGKSAEFNRKMQEQTDIFFTEINKSNFSQQMGMVIENMSQTGTAAISVEWRDDGLNFVFAPWHTIFFDCGANKTVHNRFKEHKMPARAVANNWANATFSEEFKQLVEKSPNKKVTVIEYVTKLDITDPRWTKEKPYVSDVYLKDVGASGETWIVLDKSETSSPRMIIARWSLAVNTDWGQGVGHQVRNDMLSVNELAQAHLEGAEFRAKPPGFTEDETLANNPVESGKLYFSRSGITFPQFSDLGEVAQDIQALQAQIKALFHDQTLPAVEVSGVMTATEITVRQSEFFRSLGVVAVMLEEELLKPLVASIVSILQDVGTMEKIAIGPNEEAEFEFFSLVRRSKNIESVRNDMEALQTISQFGEQTVAALVKVNELAKSILERLDFTAAFIKDDEDLARNEQIQQATEAASQIAASLGATTGQGSGDNPIQQVLQNLTSSAS